MILAKAIQVNSTPPTLCIMVPHEEFSKDTLFKISLCQFPSNFSLNLSLSLAFFLFFLIVFNGLIFDLKSNLRRNVNGETCNIINGRRGCRGPRRLTALITSGVADALRDEVGEFLGEQRGGAEEVGEGGLEEPCLLGGGEVPHAQEEGVKVLPGTVREDEEQVAGGERGGEPGLPGGLGVEQEHPREGLGAEADPDAAADQGNEVARLGTREQEAEGEGGRAGTGKLGEQNLVEALEGQGDLGELGELEGGQELDAAAQGGVDDD